jgi:hypothetical protein
MLKPEKAIADYVLKQKSAIAINWILPAHDDFDRADQDNRNFKRENDREHHFHSSLPFHFMCYHAHHDANCQEADHGLKPNQWLFPTHDVVACVLIHGFLVKPFNHFDLVAIVVVFCRGGAILASLNIRTREHRHAQNQDDRQYKDDPSLRKQYRKDRSKNPIGKVNGPFQHRFHHVKPLASGVGDMRLASGHFAAMKV